eukprot:GHVQ01017052.1.p1 GENE.GHVQ01017052.1~~GHVQ01017052.1.p1  ORF type:complete len:1257 (-),score=115.08 GHVQ01017052.1:2359-6129(-)
MEYHGKAVKLLSGLTEALRLGSRNITRCMVEILNDKQQTNHGDLNHSTQNCVLSGEDLFRLVDHAKAVLVTLGVREGSVVGLVLPNGVCYVASFIAVIELGAIAAPLNMEYTVEEFTFYFRDTNVEFVIVANVGAMELESIVPLVDNPVTPTQRVCKAVASFPSCSLVQISLCLPSPSSAHPPDMSSIAPWNCILHLGIKSSSSVEFKSIVKDSILTHSQSIFPSSAQPPLQQDAGELLCLYLHTSGTTGRPKMVGLRHNNILSSIQNIAETYLLGKTDVTLLVMPLFHVHGLMAALLSTISSGGTVVIPKDGRFSAKSFIRDCAHYGVSWYTAVPTIHQILLLHSSASGITATVAHRPRLPKLRFIRSCSSALATQTLFDLEALFNVPVLEAYAMTEAAHQMTSNPLPRKWIAADNSSRSQPYRLAGSVGLPMRAMSFAILDSHCRPVPQGDVGEVCIRGPNVIRGYISSDPDVNRQAFMGGWFHTGDQGSLTHDGYLVIKGRLKELINRGGEKISPLEIDAGLLACHDAVEEATSFGAPDDKYGEVVMAGVVLKTKYKHADPEQVTSEILSSLKQRFASFKIPTRLFFADSLPKTSTGKIQRRVVATHFLSQLNTSPDDMLSAGKLLAMAVGDGIRVVYGVVGDPLATLIRDMTFSSRIKFVGMRTELSACYAAAAHGYLNGGSWEFRRGERNSGNAGLQLIGHPGIAIVSGGPGFAACLPGLAHARVNRMPVVLISTSYERHEEDGHRFQEWDHIGAAMPNGSTRFCKDIVKITDLSNLSRQIRCAMSLSTSGVPGPVYVDMMRPVLRESMPKMAVVAMEARQMGVPLYDDTISSCSDTAVSEAFLHLLNSKKPLLVFGEGVAYAHAELLARRLSDLLSSMPVLTTPTAKGIVRDGSPQLVNSSRATALMEADVALVVGAKLNWILHCGRAPRWNKNTQFIHVDIELAHQGKHTAGLGTGIKYLPVIGDIRTSLCKMIDYLRGGTSELAVHCSKSPPPAGPLSKQYNNSGMTSMWSNWLGELRRRCVRNESDLSTAAADLSHNNKGLLFKPSMGLVGDYVRQQKSRVVVISEGGNTMDVSRIMIPVLEARGRMDAGTWGTMGVGLPYSVACALSEPDAIVVAIEGDSAFGFSCSECETICRLKLKILIVVFNNSAIYGGPPSQLVYQSLNKCQNVRGGYCRQPEESLDPHRFVLNGRYDQILSAFGGSGYYADEYETLKKSLIECLDASKLPALINVIIDATDTPTMSTASAL